MMQRLAGRPVQTFTIGFRERKWDEAPAARAVADHLGTAHTEQYVSGNDALQVIPDLPRIYDEPFADPSELPTVLVTRLARSGVTVALSGDGADETFGGYGRYRRVLGRWDKLRRWPQASRHAAAWLRDLSPETGGWRAGWKESRPPAPSSSTRSSAVGGHGRRSWCAATRRSWTPWIDPTCGPRGCHRPRS